MKIRGIAECSKYILIALACVIAMIATNTAALANSDQALREDKQQVKRWNSFAERVYSLHKHLVSNHDVTTKSEQGGYARQPNVYTETRYYDKTNHHLLSVVQRMNDNLKLVQEIEVNIYDKNGHIVRDYQAAYLPYNRNAPIQTLINLHAYHDGLHGFRQFDASGEPIYEQCEGQYQGKPVMMSLEEDQFSGAYRDKKVVGSEIYKTCFAGIPTSAAAYLDPLKEIDEERAEAREEEPQTADDVEKLFERYTSILKEHPRDIDVLIKRGDLYFKIHEFEQAIQDYSDAIDLDDHADVAYFGRGMALGRYGQIREGIKDLSVYIARHPNNTRAHTKRGIRYLWIHETKKAEQDFRKAIQLDGSNSEAHDDLGVIIARRGDYAAALDHFKAAVQFDPTYFKAFHNQAMVYYITGNDVLALAAVERALALAPDQRNSMLLKADILSALGRTTEAAQIKSDAEFVPAGNWSERISVH